MKPNRDLRFVFWLAAGISVFVLTTACSGGGSGQAGGGAPDTRPTSLVKISTQAQGLVQVKFSDLQAAGFAQDPLPVSGLQLTNQGQPVAIHVSSTDGKILAAGDSFQFYAQAVDTQYTGTNVYWLSARGTAPDVMATRNGAVSGSPVALNVFYDTLHLEQNTVFNHYTPGAPVADFWFWQILTAPTAQGLPFQLAGLSESSGASSLKVCFLGKTASGTVSPDHHVIVSLNGTQVADLTWTGITEEIQTIPLPLGILTAGANTLTLSLPGDTGAPVDSVFLNYFEIQYWRPLQAVGGQLAFGGPTNYAGPIQVGGFPASTMALLDVTDPLNPAFVTPTTGADGGGMFHLLFQDPSANAKSYFALTPDQVQAPASMETWQPGVLRTASNAADYILITPRAFLQAAQPLCDLRKSQGLRAKAVAVEDIYNEFGYGLPVPNSIKAFLGFARQNWVTPAPTYVLLLGDATFDYRDRMGTGKLSQVPAYLSVTTQLGLTPDDNWYVALDGVDEIASMLIGRLPSADATQAAQMVQKLIQYETSTTAVPSSTLLVADNNDTSFQTECDALASLLPSNVATQKIYLSQYSNYTQCTLEIISAINQGIVLTTYNGHGDVTDWAGEQVFNASCIPLLNNASQPTCMLMLNCENAWFAMAGYYCLAESVVQAQGRGAIAAFGCSGLGYEWEHDLLGAQFFNLFFAGGNATIGAICTQAKVNAYKEGASVDLLRTFTLIGDPATRVKLPK